MEHFYVSLNVPFTKGEFSGDGTELVFSLEQLTNAHKYIENIEFYDKELPEDLHPLVAMLSSIQYVIMDPREEKDRTLLFIEECIRVAKKEGVVALRFG